MAEGLKNLTARFLAERHALMAFISGLVRDGAAAEDLFQEVWLRLAEAAERGTPVDDLGKWCRGVARNLILHYWRDRREGRIVTDPRVLDLAAKAFDEQEGASRFGAARRQALAECVDGLPAPSQELLRLKYERGLTVEAVAARVKRPYNGIMMGLSRIRRALADCVQKRIRPAEESP